MSAAYGIGVRPMSVSWSVAGAVSRAAFLSSLVAAFWFRRGRRTEGVVEGDRSPVEGPPPEADAEPEREADPDADAAD